ncbi:methyl-accepting chemotaxis protein [Franzmannia pantelleriensis]|uniref:Methyl-accepting chemotaxis protein n=1 Tax=Franzmannia pantelleriensis TaxID=48727 RepID=A0A1G9KPU9_9GAMM|nr:methyl-accepting chemotaxis protein [Halomonas pantelleriensis]SDL51729.1 methyl-accepting chemotaxis protein [Halomonas pantelleriensis]
MQGRLSLLKGRSIKTRLLACFAVIIVLMIALTAVGVGQVNSIDTSLTLINDVNGEKQRHAIDFRGSVHDRAISLRDVTLVDSNAALDTALGEIASLEADYQQAAAGMASMFASRDDITAEERAALADIEAVEARTMPLVEAVVERRLDGDVAGARELLLEQASPAFSDWLASINTFIDLQESMNAAEASEARALAGGFQILMLVLCGGAVIVALLLAAGLTRQLLRELGAEPHEVRAFAEAVGRGELVNTRQLRKHDTRSIMASLVVMSQQLQSTVFNVRQAAEEVASNSEQIAEGNNELASRTEQQASALTETATAMEQLSSSVKLNADNARQADTLADEANRVAGEGGESVQQLVATMQDIRERSQEVSEIISMIDGIAFQTNILALNASVEAARAGEHGRGFAVVASEVRNLAQRSADSAKQIEALISANVERIEQGAELAGDAGRSTQEIIAAIDKVTQYVSEISHATAEQSVGVTQAGQAVSEMDHVTQQNAGLVEESASAADNLRRQARRLVDSVAVFTLEASSDRQSGARVAAGEHSSPLAAAPRSTVPGQPMLAARMR